MSEQATLPRTEAEWAVHDAQGEVERTRRQLVETMRDLAERLADEASRLDADADRSVNSLGVVQGRGGEVDRLCALLHERRSTLAKVERLVSREQTALEAEHAAVMADDVEDSPHWMATVEACPSCAEARRDHLS